MKWTRASAAAACIVILGAAATSTAHADPVQPRSETNPLLLGLSIHVEGFTDEVIDRDRFDRHVGAITSFAEIAQDHGAIVTFEFSEVFLDAVNEWGSSVIDDLKALGQATAIHADVGGQGEPSLEEMVEDLERQRAKAEPLGVDLRHVSGVCSRGPWVEAVMAAGYQSVNGPVEYCALSLDPSVVPSDWDLEGCTTPAECHGPLQVDDELVIHPYFIDSSSDFILPKESGLVFMIGDSGSTAICKAESGEGPCVGDSADIPLVEQTLEHYLDNRDPDRVGALSMSWSIGSIPNMRFVEDYFSVFDDAVASGQARWASNGDIGQAVLDLAAATKVDTTTKITSVAPTSSGKTQVKGKVTPDSGSSSQVKGGTVNISVKRAGGSWTVKGTGTVQKDGSFSIKIDRAHSSGTRIKAEFLGTDHANASSSTSSRL